MLLLTGLCNQSGVKCKDSGAEEVEILSDSIQELTPDNCWLKPDICLALTRVLGGVQNGDKYNVQVVF